MFQTSEPLPVLTADMKPATLFFEDHVQTTAASPEPRQGCGWTRWPLPVNPAAVAVAASGSIRAASPAVSIPATTTRNASGFPSPCGLRSILRVLSFCGIARVMRMTSNPATIHSGGTVPPRRSAKLTAELTSFLGPPRNQPLARQRHRVARS